MDIELSQDESEAVEKALRSYLADLRMEISDTDNPEYKRNLREERTLLEGAVTKLSGARISDASVDTAPTGGARELRVVRLWWTTGL